MSQNNDSNNITVTPIKKDQKVQTDKVQENSVPTADLIIVLDESGSMGCMGNEPVESVNTFITEQKKLSHDPNATLSLYKFNTNVNTIYKDVKLSEINEFTEYYTAGMTALWDAIGKAITEKLVTDRNRNVVMLIITDGYNNASNEFDKSKIRNLITKVEKEYNWVVQMIGANINTAEEGRESGIRMSRCANFNQAKKGDLHKLIRTASEASTQYRKCLYKNIAPGNINLENLHSQRSQNDNN